jgi:hypothetical protein
MKSDLVAMLRRYFPADIKHEYPQTCLTEYEYERQKASDRIEKLEATLRWICGSRTIEYFDGTVQADETKMLWTYRRIAREALEGTYDERIFKDPT